MKHFGILVAFLILALASTGSIASSNRMAVFASAAYAPPPSSASAGGGTELVLAVGCSDLVSGGAIAFAWNASVGRLYAMTARHLTSDKACRKPKVRIPSLPASTFSAKAVGAKSLYVQDLDVLEIDLTELAGTPLFDADVWRTLALPPTVGSALFSCGPTFNGLCTLQSQADASVTKVAGFMVDFSSSEVMPGFSGGALVTSNRELSSMIVGGTTPGTNRAIVIADALAQIGATASFPTKLSRRRRPPALTNFRLVSVDEIAALFEWKATNAEQCFMNDGDEPWETSGTVRVKFQGRSTVELTVQCKGPEGSTSSTLTAEAPRAPPPPLVKPQILSFRPSPTSIKRGRSSRLSWKVEGAETCSMNPDGQSEPVEGSRRVRPRETTTYDLMCTGPGGTATASVQVEVEEDPEDDGDDGGGGARFCCDAFGRPQCRMSQQIPLGAPCGCPFVPGVGVACG